MNNWRAPYFSYNQGSYYQTPFGFQQPTQMQQGSMLSSQPMTPYQQFAKPQQPQPPNPQQWNGYHQQAQWGAGGPVGAPGQPIPKGLISYFHDDNGQLDLDKMLSTFGQMANTYQQVSPIVKGIGSFLKGMK
ncbi:YppG family protein [Aquibacillus albus]|uniref:Spore coat protein n=1 Tax=Aquibacillus albus TaxID=1168171 RepID=A0ABS2MYW3_9BACI|nr:YppG family protein [Aquibacillus albus]MBM7571089.1 hypothetical protein [Aquibacillus albus]